MSSLVSQLYLYKVRFIFCCLSVQTTQFATTLQPQSLPNQVFNPSLLYATRLRISYLRICAINTLNCYARHLRVPLGVIPINPWVLWSWLNTNQPSWEAVSCLSYWHRLTSSICHSSLRVCLGIWKKLLLDLNSRRSRSTSKSNSNFYPISNLKLVSKIIERAVAVQVKN